MRVLSFVLLLSSVVTACRYKELPPLGATDGSVTGDAPGGCTGSAAQCGSDNALYQCDSTSGQLTKVEDCQYGCTVDRCKACDPNTTFCSADDLVSCDANGNIVNPMTCANGCQASQCNACKPGTSSCNASGNAVTCGPDGNPETPVICGANGCVNGVCNSCTPNTVTCNGDTLVTCGGNGTVQATTACSFGCASTATSHCKVFTPSYGLSVPTGTQTDIVISDNATLDLTNCANGSVNLTIGTTATTLMSPQVSSVAQAGGTPICVVRFKKLTVMAGFQLNVTNDSTTGNVLSLEGTDDISIAGTINFAYSGRGPAPGADANTMAGINYAIAPGAGGGGAVRAGGNGGACTGCNTATPGSTGGGAISDIRTVLRPGSVGGTIRNGMFQYGIGGGGGGAMHLLSMTRVTVASTGRLIANGFGGHADVTTRSLGSGGGSGGTIVIEAPSVTFSANALAVANGGGAEGGCPVCMGFQCTNAAGENGQLSANRAAGGNCNGAGNGGWEANGDLSIPANGANANASAEISAGGGGGASGFVFLRGKAGANVTVTGAVISPPPTIEGVTAN